MKPSLVFITHVVSRAVVDGFIPAAESLGYTVIVLTDHGPAHQKALPDLQVYECDVFNPIAVLDLLLSHHITPQAVFSNSDHLQTSTAWIADMLGLPAKSWRICYDAKNKFRMRQRLEKLQLPTVWNRVVNAQTPVDPNWPFPLVLKPIQGVASMDVVRMDTPDQLEKHLSGLNTSQSVLLEAFMDGPLVTLETLGDGTQLHAIGGFDVNLSKPPYFVETSAHWNGPICTEWRAHMLRTVEQFGVGLGACHSEFIITPQGPTLVEINYRSIGDDREFLLNQLVEGGWFLSILKAHLGQRIQAVHLKPTCAHIEYLLAPQAGILNVTPQIPCNESTHYRAIKQQGDVVHVSHSNKDYIGVLTFQANTNDELQRLRIQAQQMHPWSIQ